MHHDTHNPLPPDLIALGFGRGYIPDLHVETPVVEVLVYALDSETSSQVDPTAVLLGDVLATLDLLEMATRTSELDPEQLATHLHAISKKITAARELHRRGRVALIAAIGALPQAPPVTAKSAPLSRRGRLDHR